MPEIPNYQSRGTSPGSIGLEPAPPGIVGGNAIVQGLSNVSQGLLVVAARQRMQDQAEQVAVASNLEGAVAEALFKKAQELRETLAQDPNKINPREVNRDYQAHVDLTIDTVLNDPDVQRSPQLYKHLSTHLHTATRAQRQAFQAEMNKSWQDWNQFQGLQGIDRLTKAAALDPATQSQYETLIQQNIAGLVATQSLTGEQGDTAWKNARLNIVGQRATNIIETQPEDYLDAVRKGTTASFWNDRGVSQESLTPAQRKEHLGLATELADRNRREQERIVSEATRLRVERHHKTDQSFMAKFLDHAENQAKPALTFHDIAGALKADQLDGTVARAMENMLKADATGAALRSDPRTLSSLFTRMALPWGNPDKLTSTAEIYTAVAQKKVSVQDARPLLKDFDTARTEDGGKLLEQRQIFLNGQKPSIDKSNPLMGKMDQEGSMLYANFHQMVLREEAKAVRENRDPHTLYDPQSKDYLGLRTGPFIKTIQESIRTAVANLKRTREEPPPQAENPKARLPNETPAQYLERRNK